MNPNHKEKFKLQNKPFPKETYTTHSFQYLHYCKTQEI